MRRRELLCGLTTGISFTGAGCLGYDLEEKSDIQSRKKEISKLESRLETQNETISDLESTLNTSKTRISELEERLDSKNETISDLKTKVGNKETEVNSLSGEIEYLNEQREIKKKEKIELAYAHAIDAWDVGIGIYDSAKQSYSNDRFELAARNFALVTGWFGASASALLICEHWSDENSLVTARQYSESAAQYVYQYQEAARDLESASLNYHNGDYDTGDDYISKSNTDIDNASDYKFRELNEIQSALKLDDTSISEVLGN